VAEGMAASNSAGCRDPIEILQNGLPEISTGRKVVDGIALAASFAQSKAAEGMSTLKDRWNAARKLS
jgi:hypothetical protein